MAQVRQYPVIGSWAQEGEGIILSARLDNLILATWVWFYRYCTVLRRPPEHVVLEIIPKSIPPTQQTGSARALVQGKSIEFAIQHNSQASITGILWGKSKPHAIHSCEQCPQCTSTILSPTLRSSTERSAIAHERLRTRLHPRQHLCCCNSGFRI
ncbi:hypothetical protein HOY80DRAFT_1008435 [Tuber brumale]|nr:hypothetical protein HOY80DRAFT_1008435 [Tuber brumale]